MDVGLLYCFSKMARSIRVAVGVPRVFAFGEVVFSTGMVGYPEALSDPSYRGQILVLTNPMIGNYGVNLDMLESQGVQVTALVVHELTDAPHWSSHISLREWFEREEVPIVQWVDTRALTKELREKGVMKGALGVWDSHGHVEVEALWNALKEAPDYDEIDHSREVSPKSPLIVRNDRPLVAILDCGLKLGIVRELLARGLGVIRLPCYSSAEEIWEVEPDALLLGNGPGNPELLREQGEIAVELASDGLVTMGICLGHQLIALGLGAKTFKMRYGHRGQNKPVKDLRTGRCYVTSQNHGYAVSRESLREANLREWFVNADDSTLEGAYHEELPIATTQFHPESSPGPMDTAWIFDLFVKAVREGRWRL